MSNIHVLQKLRTYLLISAWFIFIFLLLVSCNKSSNPTGYQEEIDIIEKSSKRGIAYNLKDSTDFSSLKDGVSWWYNWYYETDAPEDYYSDYQMEFIPMLWGGNSDTDFLQVKKVILEHPEIEYLLVLNEPNLTDQANQTPAQAVSEWEKYEQVVQDLAAMDRTVYLVGPAMNWGTMDNYWDPVVWLDAFYEAYESANNGQEPLIDYLAFHWYDYGLSEQLDRLTKYGKQIWITEMANWNSQIDSYEKQAEQMMQMVAVCESRDDVFRYAWFIGRGTLPDANYTYLFDPDPGNLNELGQLYISLPYSE